MRNEINRSPWVLMVFAASILMITMGIRQSVGLFMHPLEMATGLSVASVSFALAIGQLMWGAVQPVFGIMADRRGPLGVLILGGLLLAAGQVLTIVSDNIWLLVLSLGLIAPSGAGAGSFSVLIGATAGRLPVERRSFAGGFINAGGSLGQFIFALLIQLIMNAFGWVSALVSLAVAALMTIPLSFRLCAGYSRPSVLTSTGTTRTETSILSVMGQACRNGSYLLLHAGFFTCGFHVAFLVTHLPGEVALCGHTTTVSAVSLGVIGLFNIAGSLLAGILGNHFKMKYILATMYGSRAVMIALFLAAPKTETTFYVFAAATGLTWLATVPPTAGIVGKLFGTRYLATLFGLTLFTHQIGGFLGAWLGGIVVEMEGSYQWVWYMDIALAASAALLSLPIRERKAVELA